MSLCKIEHFISYLYKKTSGKILLNICLYNLQRKRSKPFIGPKHNLAHLVKNKPKIVLYLLETPHDRLVGHFCLLKGDKYLIAVNELESEKNIIIKPRVELMIEETKQIKPVETKVDVVPTYIWDCEADTPKDGLFSAYAVGIAKIDMNLDVDQIKKEDVMIFDGR